MTSRLRTPLGILVTVVAGLVGTTVLAQGPFAPAQTHSTRFSPNSTR